MRRALIMWIAVSALCAGCASQPSAPPVKAARASDSALRPVKQTRRLCEDPSLLVRDLTVAWNERVYLEGPCPRSDAPLGTHTKR